MTEQQMIHRTLHGCIIEEYTRAMRHLSYVESCRAGYTVIEGAKAVLNEVGERMQKHEKLGWPDGRYKPRELPK